MWERRHTECPDVVRRGREAGRPGPRLHSVHATIDSVDKIQNLLIINQVVHIEPIVL
jgi:hypothetical protein